MKVVTIVGARPQFIKAAPLSRELRREHREVLVHTGQHYDDGMSGVFFRELGVPEPDYNLGVGSGTHGQQTGEMLKGIEEVLLREAPDRVIVYGDTNSTLAGALAAAKLHVPVAHVEAGVRSYNRAMAEEINRVLTDRIADLLFCPTPSSVENLAREGIAEGVHVVGDVMRDALLMFLPRALERSSMLQRLEVAPKEYALLTLHRAENVDDDGRLRGLVEDIGRLDLPVVFPVHPRTRKRLEALGLMESLPPAIRAIPPVGYLDMLALQSQARVVLTDSGGVQREAYFLSVPSVILRGETEWPELVQAGASVLAGGALTPETLRAAQRTAPSDLFGGGDASRKIALQIQASGPGLS
jgi:UDP-N-acetylglucosamine 2-epimerase